MSQLQSNSGGVEEARIIDAMKRRIERASLLTSQLTSKTHSSQYSFRLENQLLLTLHDLAAYSEQLQIPRPVRILRTQKKSELPNESISIGVPQDALAGLVFIAQEQGYFRDEGINAQIVAAYSTGKQSLKGMLNGEVDLTVCSTLPLVFQNFERAEDFRILATVGTSDNACRVLARKDRSITKPEDLRGKTIATERASASHYYLDLFLLKYGIDNANIIFMKADDIPQALADGKIDAFSMHEPFVSKAVQLVGPQAIAFLEVAMLTKRFNLVASSQAMEHRASAILKVLRALVRAEIFARESYDAAIRIVSDACEYDLKPPRGFEYVNLEVTMSHSLVFALDDLAEWAIVNAFVERREAPDSLTSISTDALQEAKPYAVTIVE